jgi:hypothetical protein
MKKTATPHTEDAVILSDQRLIYAMNVSHAQDTMAFAVRTSDRLQEGLHYLLSLIEAEEKMIPVKEAAFKSPLTDEEDRESPDALKQEVALLKACYSKLMVISGQLGMVKGHKIENLKKLELKFHEVRHANLNPKAKKPKKAKKHTHRLINNEEPVTPEVVLSPESLVPAHQNPLKGRTATLINPDSTAPAARLRPTGK